MTDAPPRPFHRWASNESLTRDVPYKFDRCLACRVLRTDPAAAEACPQGDPS